MHIVNSVTPTFLEKRDEQPSVKVLGEGLCERLHFAGEMAAQSGIATADDDKTPGHVTRRFLQVMADRRIEGLGFRQRQAAGISQEKAGWQVVGQFSAQGLD